MSRKRVLITGSSGMLGIDLVRRLYDTYDVVCSDVIDRKNPYREVKNFIKCDITDAAATVNMVKTVSPDAIVHAAALTDVDRCETEPERAMGINAAGTRNVALGAKERNALVFYISSDFVFDGEKISPYKEDDIPNPVNVYGASKFKGETFIKKTLDRYFIVRTSWLFGGYGKNFVDVILDKVEKGEVLRVVIDQFGSPTYTVDLSAALEKLVFIGLGQNDTGGIYHFSNAGSCSWYKYAEQIIRLANKTTDGIIPITSEELARSAKRPKMSILDTEKYASLFGETPRGWESALDEYLFSGPRQEKIMYKTLKSKIDDKSAKIGVVGLGYVGLPLAVAFAEEGFETFGIDISREKVHSIARGKSYIIDVLSEKVEKLVSSGLLNATTNYSVVRKLDAIIICVPTPLGKTKEPDISFIVSAVRDIIRNRKKGQLYVLESTTYPGTTEEVLLPRFKDGSYKLDKDFFLAFSPERVDPSNRIYTTNNIPKVVGGVSKKSTLVSKLLYEQIVDEVIPVSSSKVAEMAKLLENTFRSVNIGLVNELALMCEKLHINVWEVINAAKTKPFGFMPFYPGPGIGGHCISIDPLYLSWKARLHGFEARFIELADGINSGMPQYVVQRVAWALNEKGKSIKGSRVAVLGASYKKDVDDLRESPSIEIMKLLMDEGALVAYCDPHVPGLKIDGKILKSSSLGSDFLRKQDCVVLATDHDAFNYDKIRESAKLIFDARNAFASRGITGRNIIAL